MNSERRLDDILHDAAETNYLSGVVCEVNGRYLCGTPLHIFATRGDFEACKILLEAGAEVDVKDGDGYTQLHCAAEQGHIDTVRLLLGHGSNPSLMTPWGSTEYLAEDFPEILELIRDFKEAEVVAHQPLRSFFVAFHKHSFRAVGAHLTFCKKMKRPATGIWSHLRAMPGTLKGVTITLWVCGVLSMVASVLPGWRDESGRDVTLRELWSEGSGPLIIACGLALVLIGTLIYRGSGWVRHALMFGIVAAGLSGFFRREYEDVPVGLVATVAAIAIFLGARYLYFRQEVIAYFTRESSNAEQAMRVNRR